MTRSDNPFGHDQIIGESAELQHTLQQASVVGPTDSSVMIIGETGTGKDLIASMIHNLSWRRSGAFVKVNCAAIPLGLLESELFGHEKGAFTGAIMQRIGRFEVADQGTLFLDEVGDIPLELQPKLLRVLQDQEFERLGSTKTIRTNVRLITATHCDLLRLVKEAKFRMDLYYRLSVFPLSVPPLRDRREDIPLLVWHFIQKFAGRMNKHITTVPPGVMDSLALHSWVGNIRELQNFIERAVILSTGCVLEAPLSELKPMEAETVAPSSLTLRDAERAHIVRILSQSNGVISAAAALLGIPRSTLFYKMRRLGITQPPAKNSHKKDAA